MDEYPKEYHQALKLLIALWRNLEPAYKQKYARNIWEQFQHQIRSAAYTGSLSRFYNSLCFKLQIGMDGKSAPDVVDVLNCGDDRRILKQLREESSTLVLMVRIENEKRKEEWKQREKTVKPVIDDNSLDTLFSKEF